MFNNQNTFIMKAEIITNQFDHLLRDEEAREVQLQFLEDLFDKELEYTEEVYAEGMSGGYYDWGEFRHGVLLAVSTIVAVFTTLGDETRAQSYKNYYNDMFINNL